MPAADFGQIFNDDIAGVAGRRAPQQRQRTRAGGPALVHQRHHRTPLREILDRQLFPNGFVQQHILHATGHNGGLIALRACVVIRLGMNGLISRIDEYFNPAEVAPLLS